MKNNVLKCRLEGLGSLIFDRYSGDNNTQLPTHERLYLDEKHGLVLPSLNLYSLLAAENTKSVCRQFLGKQGKTIALGIAGYVSISPELIPILNEKGEQIMWTGSFDNKILVHKSVARLAKGIPNPKTRPMVRGPWALEFNVNYIQNNYCTLQNLRQAFDYGGSLGIGTFRPYFGRYQLVEWKEE